MPPPKTYIGDFPLGGMMFSAWINGRQGLLIEPMTPSPTFRPTSSPTVEERRLLRAHPDLPKWIEKPMARNN